MNLVLSNTPEYRAWVGMKNRCYRESGDDYADYGGRGISVCDEWIDSFDRFISDMGYRPKNKKSLDRINNNLGYSAINCRWADDKQQANNKRNNIHVEINGVSRTLGEWASFAGISYQLLYGRHNRGIRGGDLIRSDRIGTYYLNGVGRPLNEWSEITGIKCTTICQRIKYGWSVEEALTKGAKNVV